MQQATCAHSGADNGTSSGNIEISSAPSRRALLGFASVGALAIAAPIAAMPTHASRWDNLREQWERAGTVAADYNDGEYERERVRIEEQVGEMPPLWFEHTARDGHTARYAVDPNSNDPFFSPVLDRKHRAAAEAWNNWRERARLGEADQRWRAASARMDALYGVEDRARAALMKEPAPDGAALAFKVQLAIVNDELWDADRAALLIDSARLCDG